MPTFIGKPKKPKTPGPYEPATHAEEKAERESRFVAEVYVNRRKVGEHRAPTEEQAHAAAETDKRKYPNSRVSIILREAPRVKK